MVDIFIEGNEKAFLIEVIKSIGKENELSNIDFISTSGYTNLKLNEVKLKENNDLGKTNLIIFDADSNQNGGGFANRLAEINATLVEIGVRAEIFLLPNHHDDGDYESLLEQCINPTHIAILSCFERYQECVAHNNVHIPPFYSLPDRKAKIYSYISIFRRSNSEKERFKNEHYWGFDNPEYWNMNSYILNSLKVFLNTHI